jgi:Flp pilus assembly protein TadG
MANRVTSQTHRCSESRGQRGSQLLEMALALPFLLVFVVGLSDFGGAYNLKQKLSNAAREGARFGISQSPLDLGDSPPASIVAIQNTVANYLTNAGLTTCTFSSGSPTASGSGTTRQWTISGGTNCSIVIQRGNATITSGGTTLVSTQVSVTYPVSWTFNKVIGLLSHGSSPALPVSLTSVAFMENLP